MCPTKLSNTIPWHGPGTSPKLWENITYCQDEINTTRCY